MSATEPSKPTTPVPDSAVPESAEPESVAPESAAPESAAPETAAPESAEPESAAPGIAVSDSAVPQDAASEGAATEGAATEGAAPETSNSETPVSEAPATPVPAPPVPGPPRIPRPPRTPAPAAAAAPVSPVAAADSADWGRVAEDGTVEVREGEQWRVVGQFPDGTADEALAYFVRKFDDVAFKVHTLEQRHQAGGASASDLTTQAKRLVDEVTDAAAVGDLASLRARLDSLTTALSEASAAEAQQAKELVDAAIAERTVLVESIEEVAARDLSKVQWKQVTEEVTALFDAWQAQQQSGPRLPKGISQQLWKRFRDARSVVDKSRRAFYSDLDETHKAARDRKVQLIERAEALAPKGVDGIPAYRTLLDDWKASGRAGRKADDALWARFKAAGDALYAARAEQSAADEAESAPKIEAREALLEDAKAVADESNIKRARALLTRIQQQWDDVGRIFPRDRERGLDDKLRVIEQALKSREEVDWKRNNPETKARANDMSQQLLDAIDKLEGEKVAAEKSGDKKAAKEAADALEARRAWLNALDG